jgi:Rnk N-terminus
MRDREIVVTEFDHTRLRTLLEGSDAGVREIARTSTTSKPSWIGLTSSFRSTSPSTW